MVLMGIFFGDKIVWVIVFFIIMMVLFKIVELGIS